VARVKDTLCVTGALLVMLLVTYLVL